MEQKNTPAGGRPDRGESGASNRLNCTTLWCRLQVVEPIVDRVVGEVAQ